MRILAAEPDNAVLQSIELMLKSESMHVYATDSGVEAVDLGKLYDYDAITLELALPDMSGYDVIRQLRTAKVRTPILVVSGLGRIDDRVKALGVGADDYLLKPFHKDELVARLHALVRRSHGHPTSMLKVGDLVLNLEQRRVYVNDELLHLSAKEYGVLELMMLRKGNTISKEMFLNHLYGGMDEPELKIIDVFVCKVRKKLNAHGVGHLLETVWGRGYLIRDPKKQPGSASLAPELADANKHFGRWGLKPNGLLAESIAIEKSPPVVQNKLG